MADEFNISFPTYPAADYQFLASVGISKVMFESMCVKEASVTSVSSLVSSKVTIEMDGVEFTDVPVWIHTDQGTRAVNVAVATTGDISYIPEDPADYFEGAGSFFPMQEGINHRSVSLYSSSSWSALTRQPRVMVIAYPSDDTWVVVAVISIIDNGVLSEFDRRTNAHPTFVPYFFLQERTGASVSNTFTLYNLQTGEVPSIPDSTYSTLNEAKGLVTAAYEHFFENGFEESRSTTWVERFCHVTDCFDESPSYLGDTTNVGGCTCDLDFSNDTWVCTEYTSSSIYVWSDNCGMGATLTVTSSHWEMDIPSAAGSSYGASYALSGKRRIIWTNRDREDSSDLSHYRPGDWSYANTTIIIGDAEYTFDAMTHTADGTKLIGESVGTNFFSFSLIQTVFTVTDGSTSTYESVGELIHDTTPAEGITTDGIVALIRERFIALKTLNPTETITLTPRIVFVPYDIRQYILEEGV